MMQIVCPLFIWLTLLGFFTALSLAVQEGMIKLRKLHQIPCHRCIFATGDYRLKCTVNPCQAFSEAAIDCLDYAELPCAKFRKYSN
jgi:hypothetical protein